jgi:hypothetical protein
MYIRWKEKPRDPQWGYDDNHRWRRGVKHETRLLIAYLVESKRVDGKPRQTAKYLASIQEKHLGKVAHQAHFWKCALTKLSDVQLPAEQRQSVEMALLKRVQRPTDEAIANIEAEALAWRLSYAKKWQSEGKAIPDGWLPERGE